MSELENSSTAELEKSGGLDYTELFIGAYINGIGFLLSVVVCLILVMSRFVVRRLFMCAR